MNNSFSGGFYGMGFIGAMVYYMKLATSFWTVVLGTGKAIFWPAIIVYKLLKYLSI
jgi:hypothetical protein